MKKNTWFEEVFLPSIFEKAQERSEYLETWLSEKQTWVCREYMECHTSRYNQWYTYKWNGRIAHLDIIGKYQRVGKIDFRGTY